MNETTVEFKFILTSEEWTEKYDSVCREIKKVEEVVDVPIIPNIHPSMIIMQVRIRFDEGKQAKRVIRKILKLLTKDTAFRMVSVSYNFA